MTPRPQWPPCGYHVRQDGLLWRAATRYGEWMGPARATHAEALQDAKRRAAIRAAA